MYALLRSYRLALIMGAGITICLTIILYQAQLMIIHPSRVSESTYTAINILTIIFCWLLLSFLIQKHNIYKVLGVSGIIVAATLADQLMTFSINPVTVPLVILFWLGVAYLIAPQFFIKYKIAILSVYGATISYFVVFRMTPDYFETYHQNFIRYLFIPLPVFIALWIYEQWRWLKTLKADKGKAELALLKSQINPHFFFNTLNNLYGLVVEKSDDAPGVVLKLSDMMRYTIYEGREEVVPLKDEIRYLENYIELHKIRYQKAVDIRFTHVVQEGLKIAPLLYIILLENAFKHGAEKMREHAYIHLHMKSEGRRLLFSIENNYEDATPSHHKGIGLNNLKKRLEYLYPKRHELIITAQTSVYHLQLNLDLI